jgi:hypothetical protein
MTQMNPLIISLITFCFITFGTLAGYYLSRLLPEDHLSAESKDTIKMTWGIIATMSALVLGLLVASAKNAFDTVNNERTDTAVKYIVLSHVLHQYGPDADAAREDLRRLVASAIKRDWPNETLDGNVAAAPDNSNLMEGFQDRLSQLVPVTDKQRALLERAQQLSGELSTARWLIIEQSTTNLPEALYIALVFWLTVLFMGLGLFAPHNKTTLTTSILGGFCVSVAIFLINDMSHPLDGFIIVSSASMHDVWSHLNQ